MLKSIKFINDYRCFKLGDIFEFRPGINLVVGDQGCGKSSLLNLIPQHSEFKRFAIPRKEDYPVSLDFDHLTGYYYFDFEKNNPRLQPSFYDDPGAMMMQVASKFRSHGETVMKILDMLRNPEIKDRVLIQDEPDGSLSIRSAYKIVNLYDEIVKKYAVQIIASVHNPIFIAHVPEVLSLEHKCWMPSAEFIESQRTSAMEKPKRKRGKK